MEEPQLNVDWYNLPPGDPAEWLLPLPCKEPELDVHAGRFRLLIEYIILMPLRRNNLPYRIRDLEITVPLAQCRFQQRCMFEVQLDLGPDLDEGRDGKKAVRDLSLFRPRGIQAVECKYIRHSLRPGLRGAYLPVLYIPYCRHNEKMAGNFPVWPAENYPAVRLDVM